MTLSSPRMRGGIHTFTPYNRLTGEFYGILRVLGNMEALVEREGADLFGGSNPNLWAHLDGNINPDLSLVLREYAAFMYELAGFGKVTIAAEPNGDVTAIANKLGTSVVDAVTGIDSVSISVTAGAPDDIKEGRYVAKVVTPTTVDIFCDTNIDFREGVDKSFVNDLLKITAAPLTVVASNDTEVAGFGFKITGGSGAIAMVAGDTAVFEVRRVNQGRNIYTYTENPVPIEFGAYAYSQKRNNNEFEAIHFPRLKLASIPQLMTEKDWSEQTLNIKILYDSALQKSFEIVDTIK